MKISLLSNCGKLLFCSKTLRYLKQILVYAGCMLSYVHVWTFVLI